MVLTVKHLFICTVYWTEFQVKNEENCGSSAQIVVGKNFQSGSAKWLVAPSIPNRVQRRWTSTVSPGKDHDDL
jgi:hypothetical protein